MNCLKHRAGEPAAEVFTRGLRAYPDSLRMRLGLAAASYLRGDYKQAAEQFFAAADMHPDDPTPYLFLGRVQAKEITQAPGYLERLERFAERAPDNAWANFYYADCLWERRSNSDGSAIARSGNGV